MPSYEELRKIFDEQDKKRKEQEEEKNRAWIEECKRRKENGETIFGLDDKPPSKQRCDHPNTIEDSTATVLWVVVMLIGSIFKGNWIIWIIATVIWAKFITRYDD